MNKYQENNICNFDDYCNNNHSSESNYKIENNTNENNTSENNYDENITNENNNNENSHNNENNHEIITRKIREKEIVLI